MAPEVTVAQVSLNGTEHEPQSGSIRTCSTYTHVISHRFFSGLLLVMSPVVRQQGNLRCGIQI